MGVLDGIRVLDLSRYLSGPTAAMLLGDYGAEVIKVEGLPGGDPARESGPFHGGESVYYMCSNRNKRSLAVDLRSAEGSLLLNELLERSDVLIENFKPGTMAKMELDERAVRARHPRLIYCSITGFGSRGPGKALPGFDQSAQAMSGLMSVTGTEATGPLRVGIAIADSTAGVFGALGIMLALYARERTGMGQLVETSLIESLMSLMNYQAQKYLSLGELPVQDGNDHPLMFPQGTFPTADEPITLASGSEAMWRRLCQVIGRPDLADDPRFGDNTLRMRNRKELRALLEEELRRRPAREWLDSINAAGVPATPIYAMDRALENDFVNALELVTSIGHATLGELKLLGRPVTVGPDRDGWLQRPPPLLGEHSAEICRELGHSSREIEEWLARGAIRDAAAARQAA
jgi:crotonobetainyl-CoA:carnitine CoA-transferase CaiB-like acyl-CoA transferase